MANAEVFNTGYQQGLQRGGEARARKQALSDEEFVSKAHELAQNRLDLQSKLPTLLDEKGQPTPQYQEAMKALQQNVEDMRELYHPQKSPGAIQKFGHILTDALHITKPTPTATMVIPNPKGLVEAGNIQIWDRPSVQNPDGTYSSEYSTSFQDDKGHEVLVPTVVNGKFLTPDGKKPPEGSDAEKAMFKAAWDHYLKTGENLGKFASAEEADAYATRLHNRGKIPKNIAKQETQQAANTAADQHTAQGIAAAAPPSPAQAATTAAGAKNVGDLAIIQGKMKNLKTLFPNAPPEQQRKWFEELAQSITGIKAGQEKYFSQLATTKDADGKEHYWRIPMAADQDPEEVDFNGQTMVPKSTAHPSTAAEAQWIRATYGKDLEQLSPEQASEAISRYKQLNTPSSTTTGQTLVYDQNNQPHVFTHTGTSTKTFPGARPSAETGTPAAKPSSGSQASPSTLKKEAEKHRPSGTASTPRSPIGPAIPGFTKLSREVTTARNDYDTAKALVDVADRAMKAPPDVKAGLQRQVAATIQNTLEKRFNQAAYDNLVQHYGIANSFQAWLDRQETGALPDAIFKQLVAIAHSNLEGKKVELQTALQGSGGSPDSGQWKLNPNWPSPEGQPEGHELYNKRTQQVEAVIKDGQWSPPQ
jgi:hypothetical protein